MADKNKAILAIHAYFEAAPEDRTDLIYLYADMDKEEQLTRYGDLLETYHMLAERLYFRVITSSQDENTARIPARTFYEALIQVIYEGEQRGGD